MVNFDFISGSKSRKPVSLSFRIPYYTHWGQSLLVCGSEPVLGSWNVKKGLLLSPYHQGDELVWRGTIVVPDGFGCEYSYYVVDDDKNVLRWEAGMKKKIMLPDALQDGEEVALHDLWQIGSDSLPFKTAFKNVIFRKQWSFDIERPLGVIQSKLDKKDSVIVQFKICCLSIEEDTSIYVIGSSVKLGRWKVQDGLKLNCAGESIWQADCVMQKDDFPIKLGAVMCMGVTASAYILTLFAMKYRERVLGLILVSPLCKNASWTEWLYNKVMSNLLYFYGMCGLVKDFLLQRYFSKEVRGSIDVPESDIVQACRRLLDARQSINVLQFLQAIDRRPDITDGLKRLKCRTLIFVGEDSPFHSDAVHMTSKLDRRYSALVEVQPF